MADVIPEADLAPLTDEVNALRDNLARSCDGHSAKAVILALAIALRDVCDQVDIDFDDLNEQVGELLERGEIGFIDPMTIN